MSLEVEGVSRESFIAIKGDEITSVESGFMAM